MFETGTLQNHTSSRDFLFAQSDAPTALTDWVTVQNNIGIATTTTPGIASTLGGS